MKEGLSSAGDHAVGFGEVGRTGGDHPCHPCSLAIWNAVAIVMGWSFVSASPMYRVKRTRFSASLYPGALRESESNISQSCSLWPLWTGASCANARASVIHFGSVAIADGGIVETAERISSIFASSPCAKESTGPNNFCRRSRSASVTLLKL